MLTLTRRTLLGTAAAGALGTALSSTLARSHGGQNNSAGVREFRLVAAKAHATIAGVPHPETEVWSYNGQVPGPEIRVRQGERLRVHVENRLPVDTTVHWHGLRLPNAMDGVSHLTQAPIAPGQTFTYEFDCPDAGTFWYHPHHRSHEQVERGLAGSLIVEEAAADAALLAADREITWLLDDWRLTREAQVAGGFGNMMDASHAGRLGNLVTLNGRETDDVPVRAGERLRLRLINAANARVFALEFGEAHQPLIVALDGHPVEPHTPAGGRVLLGPSQRADLILDCVGPPGTKVSVLDRFYPRQSYRLVDLAYTDEAPLRRSRLDAPRPLPSNPLAEPDLDEAVRHDVEFGGGAMDPKLMRAMRDGQGHRGHGPGSAMHDLRSRMRQGQVWTINGTAAHAGDAGHVHEPLLSLERGRSYVLSMWNDTAWWHPVHLHGHAFRVLSRNGEATPHREWRDTVLMAPNERVDIAFVADNPGDWMFHCHILDHQASGMMGTIRVT